MTDVKAEEFKILNDEQHIILKPNTYIGSLSNTDITFYHFDEDSVTYKSTTIIPALDKIINEIIDNSVDEHIRTKYKFANNIDITIEKNPFTITVKDNGRGIPVVFLEEVQEYRPVSAWTRSRSGTSFDEDRVSIGTNGLGSMATFCFSKKFIGETHDGKTGLRYEKRDIVEVFPSKLKGTTVSFEPDLSLLKTTYSDELYNNHFNVIKQRLINLSLCYPKIKFTLNGEEISKYTVEDIAKLISEDNIVLKQEHYSLIVASTAEVQEFRFHNYTNGIFNSRGGALVDYVTSQIANALIPLIKKKCKHDLTMGQIKNNLFIGIYAANFNNLCFDSQTKERVTNTVKEVAEYFNYDFSLIAKKIMNNSGIIDPIIQSILIKKEQIEQATLAKLQKKSKNEKIANHIPATHKNKEECRLFIVEGLSALSPSLSARESNRIGVHALQGKIDNVNKKKPSEILNTPVLKDLMTVIGLRLNQPVEDLNYGEICMLADADVDGSCISTLLLNFFAMWDGQLFDRVYRALPPLYKLTKKGKPVVYLYTKEEFDNFDSTGYNVKYFKGLGTMNKEDYAIMLNNPKLVKINWDENSKEFLDMLFHKNRVNDRKNWIMK